MSWTLWTIRNKMVIEHIFLRRASDSVFKFLAFLQQWYQLCRQWDRERLDGMLEDLLVAAHHLPTKSSRWVALLVVGETYLLFTCCWAYLCRCLSGPFFLFSKSYSWTSYECGCFIYKAGRKPVLWELATVTCSGYDFFIICYDHIQTKFDVASIHK
jgi:hypothetical protein